MNEARVLIVDDDRVVGIELQSALPAPNRFLAFVTTQEAEKYRIPHVLDVEPPAP